LQESVDTKTQLGFTQRRWVIKRSSSTRHQRIRPGTRDHELRWVYSTCM